MSRPPRHPPPPEGLYHVTTRGVNGETIYRDDHDRLHFLSVLLAAVTRHDWDVHVLCLMGNHYHLLVETSLDDLAAGMQLLNGTLPSSSTAVTAATATCSATAI